MKTKNFTLFRRILILVFTLITVLSFVFILITYLSTLNFYQVSTELLNKDVASHIAKFTSPFEKRGLNKQKADSVFYQAMVISPNVEVYFLDTNGNVMYYHGSPDEIKLSQVPLESIKDYISDSGQKYIKGADPRDPAVPKIFSSAIVRGKSGNLGYIYVILDSKQYRTLTHLLFKSSAGGLLFRVFILVLLVAIVVSWLYVRRLQQNFQNLIVVLEKFEGGDLKARFPVNSNSDLAPVTHAFNKMANMLVQNIEKLKNTEIERKDFTANISHDLRTPLAIARGYAETLYLNSEQNNISSSERDEYLKLITGNIQIVESRVQQLLDLSKIESPALTLNVQPFIFSEIVQEFVHSAQLTASEKGIKIVCINCEDPSWVSADIHLMERVIQNLLDNALKFTTNSGEITIGLVKQHEFLIFEIKNTGNPIPSPLLEWLNNNEMLFPSSRPNTRGLGLIILKTILQLHKFPLKVESIKEVENIFSFQMPVSNPSAS
jgi:signal transduction histidine kinase